MSALLDTPPTQSSSWRYSPERLLIALIVLFVTLSTVGFGDITPFSRVARMLSVMEAVVGIFYVAVLLAQLVSVYSTEPKGSK